LTPVADTLSLDESAVMAISGPSQRYLALIESAFKVLIETPGGGFALKGDAQARQSARAVLNGLRTLYDSGVVVSEADVRALIQNPFSRSDKGTGGLILVGRKGAVAAKTEGQGAYLKELEKKDLVFALGPAGSGKTFMAVAYGVALLQKKAVDRLIITRPAVEAGEKLGFLPGDLNEKVDPYLAPIWQALDDILGAETLIRRRERKEIEVAPLAYMRGRTLSNAYVIIDEAQNTTRMQMKMVLTRLGEGSKMVVTGDPSQVDLPNRRDSGLVHAVKLLEGVEGVGVSYLTAADIVRHPLVARIVKAYDAEAGLEPPAYDRTGRDHV
jgi:phosphate starvation-inducible protein PhoH and related proteins